MQQVSQELSDSNTLKAMANFLKLFSWQRAILYLIKTLKILKNTFNLDIIDIPDHPDYNHRSFKLFLSATKALRIEIVSFLKWQG